MAANSVYGQIGPPWFGDKPIAIVGGGQSLIDFDLEKLRGHAHVIAVKGCIFDLPWADCGAGADFPRLLSWLDKMATVTMPVYWGIEEKQWLQKPLVKPGCVTFLRQEYGNDLSLDPSFTYRGGTSGFHALNVGVLKCSALQDFSRRRHIFLFGYDYRSSGAGSFHHNEQHYSSRRDQPDNMWVTWSQGYRSTLQKLKTLNIGVVNASPDSAIECFEKATPNDALESIYRLGPT